MKLGRIAALLCVVALFGVLTATASATKYVALRDSYSSGTGTRTLLRIDLSAVGLRVPAPAAQRSPAMDLRHRDLLGGEEGKATTRRSQAMPTAITRW